ncbi:unnamed protein product [Arctogadus glacialis]
MPPQGTGSQGLPGAARESLANADIYNGTMATDEVSFEEVRQTLITSSWQRCSVTLSVSSVYAVRTTA